jgi:predicted nuclease of predicted toxin-antitoxin system
MRFLADQDVYASTVRFLSGVGHDVLTAGQLGLAQAEDTELLRVAHDQGRIFVTRDRDFGALVFVRGSGPGIIYLRILPSTQASDHAAKQNAAFFLLLSAFPFLYNTWHPGVPAPARPAHDGRASAVSLVVRVNPP